MNYLNAERIKSPDFHNPKLRRNYKILEHYLIFLTETGLDFLKREFIGRYSDSSIKKFSAQNFFHFVLKEYIENKVKSQIQVVLETASSCLTHLDNGIIEADFLDEIIRNRFNQYTSFDLSLTNSSHSHPQYSEIKMISKLTFRIAVIQATRLLRNEDDDIDTYAELVRNTFPTIQQCRNSVNAILSMVDQMIDCFERNLDMLVIPFYKPTFTIKDFQYMRRLYEYAQEILDEQIRKIFEDAI